MTDKELKRLKHALGFDNKDSSCNFFNAYRRCSCFHEPDLVWDGLIEQGYARRSVVGNDYYYIVTEKGMQAVADATGLVIRYELEFLPHKDWV